MHITITGNLGSGKSTICKILEEKQGFEIFSTGKVQRELAREMNLTTLEMNQLMCTDPKYDTMIDDTTARIARESREKNIIFDSRLAWHFVEQSFKVFLAVSLEVAAHRVMNDNRGKEEKYRTLEEAKELLAARASTEDKRYKEMYQLDYFNYSNYNLVIDSTQATPEVIASIIMLEAEKFYKQAEAWDNFESGNQGVNRIFLSPQSIYQEAISEEEIDELKHLVEEYKKEREFLELDVEVDKIGEFYTIHNQKEKVKAAVIAGVPFVTILMQTMK